MATSKSKSTPPTVVLKGAAIDGVDKGMTPSQMTAALATRSTLGAFTIKAYAGIADQTDEFDFIVELQKAGAEVVGGDMGRIEKMLVTQAVTLDNIFNNMAQRAAKQETFKGIEVMLRLALKAQAQARSTAEALALLKNPQPYIRQANIAQGPQQVNNSYADGSGARSFQSEPNKLLEADHGQRLDIGAQAAASRVDQTVATVGAVHRAKVGRR